jgi:hypothetical protein
MTPAETYMAIKSAQEIVRAEKNQRMWMAWHTAAFIRAKRMPRLGQFLDVPDARPLKGEEAEKRRAEFKEMVSNSKYNKG